MQSWPFPVTYLSTYLSAYRVSHIDLFVCRDVCSLSFSLPDEKILMEEILKSHTEVSVLSKFVCDCSQWQSGGSLLPKLLKIYQFLHRDLAYKLSEEEVKDMTAFQLLEKMKDLYPGMFPFNPG